MALIAAVILSDERRASHANPFLFYTCLVLHMNMITSRVGVLHKTTRARYNSCLILLPLTLVGLFWYHIIPSDTMLNFKLSLVYHQRQRLAVVRAGLCCARTMQVTLCFVLYLFTPRSPLLIVLASAPQPRSGLCCNRHFFPSNSLKPLDVQ